MRKIKNKFKVSMLTIALMTSSSVMATGQPTFDISNFIENITANISEIEARYTAAKDMWAGRKLQLDMFSSKNDADTAKAAQELKEKQKLARKLRNSEIAEKMMPHPDACRTAARNNLKKIVNQDCTIEESMESHKERQKFISTAGLPTPEPATGDGDGDSNVKLVMPDIAVIEKEDLRRTYDKCRAELLSDALASGEAPEGKSLCLKLSLLIDNDYTTIQTGKEVEGAKELINIITGPTVSKVDPAIATAAKTTSGKRALMKEYRKIALKNMSSEVLNNVLEQRHPAFWTDSEQTNPSASPLTQLEEFNAERFSQPSGRWMLKVSGLHPEKLDPDPEKAKKAIFTPDQLLRDMALIDGFMAHMAVLQYKSQLRQETMQAALLSLEVEPLER